MLFWLWRIVWGWSGTSTLPPWRWLYLLYHCSSWRFTDQCCLTTWSGSRSSSELNRCLCCSWGMLTVVCAGIWTVEWCQVVPVFGLTQGVMTLSLKSSVSSLSMWLSEYSQRRLILAPTLYYSTHYTTLHYTLYTTILTTQYTTPYTVHYNTHFTTHCRIYTTLHYTTGVIVVMNGCSCVCNSASQLSALIGSSVLANLPNKRYG